MKIKKAIAVLLSFTLAATLFAGCSGTTSSTPTPAGPKLKSVNVAIFADPGSLAPWKGASTAASAHPEIYETLFIIEKLGGELKPRIASAFKKMDDLTYQVSLYKNVADSAGNKITADDVVFSYEQATAQGNMATFIGSFKSIKKIDDYTVEIAIKDKTIGGFLNCVTWVNIVSKTAYTADKEGMANKPVATGPYVVKNYTPGSSITLVKNEKYWQSKELRSIYSGQNVDQIVYKVISEPSQVVTGLQTGSIDYSDNVSMTDLKRFQEGGDVKGFSVLTADAALTQVLLFNTTANRPTGSKELRQAINYAIDKNALIKGAYGGVGSVAKTYGNNVYGDYVKAWDTQDYFGYNAAKAKELVAKSGYSGKELVIMTGPVAAHKTMAQIIQAQLGEVGIKSKIVSYEDSLFNNYLNDPTQWDVMVTNKGSGDYVASTWRFSFDARMFKGATRGFLVDAKLQSLLEKCLDETTHTAENMDAFHQYLKDVAVGTGLLYSKYAYVHVNTMSKLIINTQNMIIPGSCTYADNFVSK